MPMLTSRQVLPSRPHRVLVAGTSGSGKTGLAQRVSEVLDIPHVEIDALFHGPGWTPRDTFETEVMSLASRPAWVTEWQYASVRDLLAERADLLAWLDLPRTTVMRQVTARTIRRRLRREVLWNGNVEPPLHTILNDQDHIIRWAWATHHKTAIRVRDLLRRDADITVVRLRSHREARDWLQGPLSTVASVRP